MFGIIIIVLLLIALKDCLSLDNSNTCIYAGKTYTGSYYINGHEGTYVSSSENTKAFEKVVAVGNTFNNVAANIAANNTYSSIEEEYAAFHCCGQVVA